MPEEDLAARTRVMVVDDHADFRHLMALLLGREPDLEVVAQAGSLAEARSHVAAARLSNTDHMTVEVMGGLS